METHAKTLTDKGLQLWWQISNRKNQTCLHNNSS